MCSSSVLEVSLCLLLCLPASLSSDGVTTDIIAFPGDNVTLPCFGPLNVPIRAVEWFRSLFYKSYVYSRREHEPPETENQLPSYEGRVSVKSLEEKKRKDTDVSLIINNVRPSDSGTYECHVFNGTVDHSFIETSFGTKSSRDVTLVVVDEVISVCPGEDVTLTCDVPMNVPFTALHWNKYGTEDPVYSCVKDQQPGRLSDCETSSSTVSMTMKNLQPDDSGVYECRLGSSEVKKRVHVLVSVPDYIIRAEPGQSVSLPCRAPRNTEITAVEWTRAELEPEYVLMIRDRRPVIENQLPSFKGRVELKDPEMKDGDVSMILNNVNRDDTGTYECRVFQKKTNRKRSATLKTEPISIVHLVVHQSDSQHASTVEIYEGEESVQLPCYYPTSDLSKPSVVWSRSNLHPPTVHQLLSDGDKLTDQNQNYRGRTSMTPDALETGKLTLTLKKPIIRDSGDYNCTIRGEGREDLQRVMLLVKEPPDTTLFVIAIALQIVLLGSLAAFICFMRRSIRRREKTIDETIGMKKRRSFSDG